MNLPITLTDSIPQQAGPGAGADKLYDELELVLTDPESSLSGGAIRAIKYVRDALSHLAAPLAVEDSRERCASSDAKRLDWLEKHFTDVHGVYVGADKSVLAFAVDCEQDHFGAGKNRIRTAIDAAMAAASSGKEN